MNNKNTVVYALAALLLISGGVFLYRSSSRSTENTQEVKVSENNQQKDQASEDQNGNVLGEESNSNTTDPMQNDPTKTTTTDSAMKDTACSRNFDENKLKTAKVNIANQTVELDIAKYGKIKVQLYDKDAPKTVENFLRLVNSGFYDCLTFHRISKGFVIQGGDPKGDGTGGQSAFGADFEDELNTSTQSYKDGYKHGVLAMANRGPNTNSSQFFILLSDYPLDHKYTIFGKVSEGLDVVDKIGQSEIIANPYMGPTDGAPKEKIVINKAVIITK